MALNKRREPQDIDAPHSQAASSPHAIAPATTPPHFFPTPALDHAFGGIVAGAVATVCMNPLDLIKVQFQVDTGSRKANRTSSSSTSALSRSFRKFTGTDVLADMREAMRAIVKRDGYLGLYRGLSPNVVGNSASWGLYFLFYTMIKEFMASKQSMESANSGQKGKNLSAGQHLLAASESGAITALITNPIWVVKTRMFTTSRQGEPLYTVSSPAQTGNPSYTLQKAQPIRGLLHGLRLVWQQEGIRGLYKGGALALVGVSNGAIQFMTYEEMKRWRMDVARRNSGTAINQQEASGPIQLSNTEYICMSGASKVAAIALTYPYQVIRSRIQNAATSHIYPNIPACIRLTYRHEGLRGFYKGMAANAVRILPGTCVTFVVYENCSWALRRLAEQRQVSQDPDEQQGSIVQS